MDGVATVAPAGRSARAKIADFVLGPPFTRRLALSHAVDDFGDAMVNLALVGSLFLSVSLDASRNRIMLYLLLAAAPLAVAAPLVGTVLDRTRIGYRVAISGTQFLRSAASLAMIGSLFSLALYPLMFLVLISRKVYALSKTALLSQMTADRDQLLRSDAHIARSGTAAGGLGTAIGGVLLATGNERTMLAIAVPAFLLAGGISRRLPRPEPSTHLRSVPRLREAIPPAIWSATVAVTAIRATGGALVYLLAFAIKRGGGDEWIFASGLLAAGAGGLVANLSSSAIHRRLHTDWILVLALLVPGVVCLIGIVTIGDLGVLAIAFSIGLAQGVSTRTIVALNAQVPALARGRTIARAELVFHVASLIGAGLAVQFAPTPNIGFGASALVLLVAGLLFAFGRRRGLRHHASRLLLGLEATSVERSLPKALLTEAERLATLGAYRMAAIVAASAVDVLIERDPSVLDTDEHQRWRDLAPCLAGIRMHDAQPPDQEVVSLLDAAVALVDGAGAPPHPATVRPSFV